MSFIVLAFVIGAIAGLRALTAPALMSWAVRLRLLTLDGSWLAFLGFTWTPWILTLFALGEMVNDKLPQTPSRKTPPQFVTRILMGGFAGAVIGTSAGSVLGGTIAGALGAVAVTFAGAEARSRLVAAIGGKDLPVALLEDATAILSGIFVLKSLS
jgi:uncharacterized membrane protein